MKRIVRLILAFLAILLSLPGTALSRENIGCWTYPSRSHLYLSQAAFESAYPPYNDQSLRFDTGTNSRRTSRDRDWIGDSSVAGLYSTSGTNPFWGPVLGAGYLSYPPADTGVIGRGWGAGRQADVSNSRSYGYSDHGGFPGAFQHRETSADYFRGYESADFDARDTPPWRYSYQFRPLTDQQRRRMDQGDGWRPRIPNPIRERPHQTDLLLPNEAYGYQTDRWVYRYYGMER